MGLLILAFLFVSGFNAHTKTELLNKFGTPQYWKIEKALHPADKRLFRNGNIKRVRKATKKEKARVTTPGKF